MISREEAARIAQGHLPDRPVRHVERYDELRATFCVVYTAEDLRGCWMVTHELGRLAVGGDPVTFVCSRTGRIMAAGSCGE